MLARQLSYVSSNAFDHVVSIVLFVVRSYFLQTQRFFAVHAILPFTCLLHRYVHTDRSDLLMYTIRQDFGTFSLQCGIAHHLPNKDTIVDFAML